MAALEAGDLGGMEADVEAELFLGEACLETQAFDRLSDYGVAWILS